MKNIQLWIIAGALVLIAALMLVVVVSYVGYLEYTHIKQQQEEEHLRQIENDPMHSVKGSRRY